MDTERKYTVFVMQSGVDSKDIYIAQTTKTPHEVVEKYNSTDNPKMLPKPLGKMLPLTLRNDLVIGNSEFSHESDAIEFRKNITEEFEHKIHTYNVRSKRSYFFGKKKSVKDKQTGKYRLALDPTLFKSNHSVPSDDTTTRNDVLSYGRKKSTEWNDGSALKLEQTLSAQAKKTREEKR